MTWATFLGFFGTMLEGLFSHPAASRNFHIGGPTKTNLSKNFCELANFFSLFFRRKIENGRKEQVLDPAADLQRARKLAHHRLALGQVLERRRLRDHRHRRRKSGWNPRSKFKSFLFPSRSSQGDSNPWPSCSKSSSLPLCLPSMLSNFFALSY